MTGNLCGDDMLAVNGPGRGGAGNEVTILGSAGAGGSGEGGQGGSSSGASTKISCGSATADPLPYASGYNADPNIRQAAQQLAGNLTDTEKQQQMSGLPQSPPGNFNVFRQEDNTSRGIKGFFFRDGPRGVNLHANFDGKHDYSTSFPVAMARGAAFDDDLEFHIGQAIGDETLASGNTMMLAPTINILRHPAWGRAQETYGEDPFLLGRLGSAFVVGLQKYIAACPKHYAANNIENGRSGANAMMDEQTLREIYARHFEMVVEEGGASAIMAAYNLVNGVKSTQSKHLLTDLLRDDFGFQGFVLSDWWAMPNGANLSTMSSVLQATAVEAVHAGLDMELPWRYNYSTLTSAIADHAITSADLTTSTARILEQKMRFHVDSTSGTPGCRMPFSFYDTNTAEITKNDEPDPAIGMSHLDLAELAARESMVLIKNENNTLPINRATAKKIAVIGANITFTIQSSQDQNGCSSNCPLDFTTNVRTGDLGSSRVFHDPAKAVSPFDGITEAAGSGVTVTRGNTAADAAGADFVVVVAGLTAEDEGEEYTQAADRTSFALDAKQTNPTYMGFQNKVIQMVAALGKPMVVVLEGASVIDVQPWIGSVPALVMAWYPGMVGGSALGRLLLGQANFSAKLPITWGKQPSDYDTWVPVGSTTFNYYTGYHWFDLKGTAPQFPFGFGLSYTKFDYKKLQLGCSTMAKDAVLPVVVNVANSGTVAGDEVVMVFVKFLGTTARRPAKELKGFARVHLEAGEEKQITIPVRLKDLDYFQADSAGATTGKWIVETGNIEIDVGGGSTGPFLTGTVAVTGYTTP